MPRRYGQLSVSWMISTSATYEHTVSTSMDQLMYCIDCGDSLEASLSGAWNGYSWVTSSSQYLTHMIYNGLQLEFTYNMFTVSTTKE
jgi:hypothetical protein